MKKKTLKFKLPRKPRRALELFSSASPFKPKIMPSVKIYSRKRKDIDYECPNS